MIRELNFNQIETKKLIKNWHEVLEARFCVFAKFFNTKYKIFHKI